jgi:hypothetical protein
MDNRGRTWTNMETWTKQVSGEGAEVVDAMKALLDWT